METNRREPLVVQFEGHFTTQQESEQPIRPVFPQAIVAALVCLTATLVGLTEYYLRTLRCHPNARSSDFEVDEEVLSWVESVYYGATPVGCMLSGIMMELWGRRRAVQISVSCLCIGCFLIAISYTSPPLVVGTAVCAFGIGASIPGIFFHLQEMADPRLRGTLSACIVLSYHTGLELISLTGCNISWNISALVGAAIALIDLVGYSLLHDSPVWYVRNSRIGDARNVFSWLWGSGHQVEVERDVEELLKRVEDEKRAVANEMGSSQTYWREWKQYLKPHVYKPFIIMHVSTLMHIVCGMYLFLYCVADIARGERDEYLVITFVFKLIFIVRLVFIVASCVILLWFERRIVCVSSGVGSGIAAVLIGTFVYMQTFHTSTKTFLVLVYEAFNTYGYLVLSPTLVGEILPSNIRCVGGAYIFNLNFIVTMFASKYFPSFFTAVSAHSIFWIFGVYSLLCSLFLYLLLPETKGRSLVQIEEYFLQPNVLWLTRKKCQNIRNTNI